MNGNDFLDALHFAFLVGLFTGVPFTMALQEAWSEFKRWRRNLAIEREVALLKPRCDRHLECIAGRGHGGGCDIQPYTE